MENIDKLYERAAAIAAKAHEGQTDKGGNPYIEHPLAVAAAVDGAEQKIVAVLHDVLEDTPVTAEDLLRQGIPEKLVEAVKLLTRDKSGRVSYEEYIIGLRHNPVARKVKMADLKHNMDLSRIPEPTAGDYKRRKKYRRALKMLEQYEADLEETDAPK